MNGSGRAPAAATIDWYEQHGDCRAGEHVRPRRHRAGAIGAWETLLKAHGRKDLQELLQPAIAFAADGWPVHQKVAWDWKRLEAKLRKNGTRASCPAVTRRTRATSSGIRNWLRRCAPLRSVAPRRFTKAPSRPTW